MLEKQRWSVNSQKRENSKEETEGRYREQKIKAVSFSLCEGPDGKTKVAMCFLVGVVVEVWPNQEGNHLFSTEYSPVVGLGKLMNVEIFLIHLCSAECRL